MLYKRCILYGILSIIALICEFSFAKYIAVGAGVPMLIFCLVILVSMNEPEREYALIFGIIAGAYYDFALGHGFGTYAILFGLTAWETATFCDSILSSRIVFLILNTFIMSIFVQCGFFLVNIIEIGAEAFADGFFGIILPTCLYNVAVCLLFLRPVSIMIAKRR